MSLKVEVTEQPGLQSILDRPDEPNRAAVEPALHDFLATPGVAGSDIEADLNQAMAEQAETAAEGFGWWDGFKAWWNGEQHKVVDTEQRKLELAAYWLTLPAVDGSKVAVSSSVSHSGEVSASLKIAGIGGGPTFTLDLKEQVDFNAIATERAFLTSTGTFEKVEVTNLAGEQIATYARLRVIDRDNFAWHREAAQPPDPSTLGSPTGSREFDVSGASGTTIETLSIASGTTWELGADLDLSALGLSAKLGTKVTYAREVTYEYELPAGSDYLARRYSSFPAYLWSVKA
jgi:hypothetical protein